jgi:hypothetical protein
MLNLQTNTDVVRKMSEREQANLIGLSNFTELVFSFLLVLYILVRMPLESKFFIRPFDVCG